LCAEYLFIMATVFWELRSVRAFHGTARKFNRVKILPHGAISKMPDQFSRYLVPTGLSIVNRLIVILVNIIHNR
jgi:hypothetical protein